MEIFEWWKSLQGFPSTSPLRVLSLSVVFLLQIPFGLARLCDQICANTKVSARIWCWLLDVVLKSVSHACNTRWSLSFAAQPAAYSVCMYEQTSKRYISASWGTSTTESSFWSTSWRRKKSWRRIRTSLMRRKQRRSGPPWLAICTDDVRQRHIN